MQGGQQLRDPPRHRERHDRAGRRFARRPRDHPVKLLDAADRPRQVVHGPGSCTRHRPQHRTRRVAHVGEMHPAPNQERQPTAQEPDHVIRRAELVIAGPEQHRRTHDHQLHTKFIRQATRLPLGDDLRVIVGPVPDLMLAVRRAFVSRFRWIAEARDRARRRHKDQPAAPRRGKAHHVQRAIDVGAVHLGRVAPGVPHQCGEVKDPGKPIEAAIGGPRLVAVHRADKRLGAREVARPLHAAPLGRHTHERDRPTITFTVLGVLQQVSAQEPARPGHEPGPVGHATVSGSRAPCRGDRAMPANSASSK